MKDKVRHIHNARMADTFLKRLKGLMFKRDEDIKQPLIIAPCRGIHTCFMRADINILILDRENRVIDKFENITKNRVVNGNRRWYYVIEFSTRMNFKFNIGDIVLWD